MPLTVPAPWETVTEMDPPLLIADLLRHSGLVSSKSEARRVIAQGGAYVNGERVADESRALTRADLRDGRLVALRRGKRHAALIEVVESEDGLASASADLVLLRIPEGDSGGPDEG